MDAEDAPRSGDSRAITLNLSIAGPEVLSQENFETWIGKLAPACLENDIRHSVAAPTKLSKDKKDEDFEKPLEAIVTRWNQERDWLKVQDTRTGYYNRVVVLPFIWEITGLNDSEIDKESGELLEVLKKYFDFNVNEVFRVPVKAKRHDASQIAVSKKINSLITGNQSGGLGRDDLLIIYYNGHGKDTFNSGGGSFWE